MLNTFGGSGGLKMVEWEKTNVFKDAANLMIDQLEKFKKKIPRTGLNNMTKPKYYGKYLNEATQETALWSIPSEPTLPRRMEKLLWGKPYLPPQMVAMGSFDGTYNDEAKELLKECFELLTKLKDKLDSVTVVRDDQVNRYKQGINDLVSYLRMSGKILGLIKEAEFSLFDVKGDK